MNVTKQFSVYVFKSILGMVGISLYLLADTYFISAAVGADGITALNLILPIYSLIFALGAMIGIGSAIRFTIENVRRSNEKDKYFFNALFWGTVIGLIFSFSGVFIPEKIMTLMGADNGICNVGSGYTRIFMSCAPFFIWNHICNAFVRNDEAPSAAMAATLVSSLFNIAADYYFMFPMKMGMEGAALATGISPLIGVMICGIRLSSKKSSVRLRFCIPSLKRLLYSCQVGISSFVGEISSGVTTAVFNGLILSTAGNTGVAAYGIVANCSLVAASMFNGIAQGSQPIVSSLCGDRDVNGIKKTVRLAAVTSLSLAAIIISTIFTFSEQITEIFNSAGDSVLAAYAENGIRLYFIGFLFAGLNISASGILSAAEAAGAAFAVSVSRGFIAIILCAVIMSAFWGLNGIWLSFAAAELITLFIVLTELKRTIYRQ